MDVYPSGLLVADSVEVLLVALPTELMSHVNEYFLVCYNVVKKWCRPEDLNPQPTDYKSVALPIELGRRMEDAGLEPATPCL